MGHYDSDQHEVWGNTFNKVAEAVVVAFFVVDWRPTTDYVLCVGYNYQYLPNHNEYDNLGYPRQLRTIILLRFSLKIVKIKKTYFESWIAINSTSTTIKLSTKKLKNTKL